MRGRAVRAVGLSIAAILLVVTGALVGRLTAPTDPARPPVGVRSSASPSISPTPSLRPEVEGRFRNPAVGERLSLRVTPPLGECPASTPKPMPCLYLRLKTEELNVFIYTVELSNRTDSAVSYDVRNFVVTSRAGMAYQTVNLPSPLRGFTGALPRSGIIPPRASVSGPLFFDGRLKYRPDKLSYFDGAQVLTIVDLS